MNLVDIPVEMATPVPVESHQEIESHGAVYPQENFHSTNLTTEEGEIKELDDIEAEMIRFAVELYNGKLSEVAKRLGIGRSTLYRRLKELGIEYEQSGMPASSKTG